MRRLSIRDTLRPVVLKLRGGTLRLQGVDGDTVRIRPAEADDLDRLIVERGTGSISISTDSGRGSPDLEIDLPAGATVRDALAEYRRRENTPLAQWLRGRARAPSPIP